MSDPPTPPQREIATIDRFDEFWEAYNYKTGKKPAQRAWAKATADADTIIQAAHAHRHWHEQAGTAKRYIPHPSTWLNQERWNDELTQPPVGQQHNRDINWNAAMDRARQRDMEEGLI